MSSRDDAVFYAFVVYSSLSRHRRKRSRLKTHTRRCLQPVHTGQAAVRARQRGEGGHGSAVHQHMSASKTKFCGFGALPAAALCFFCLPGRILDVKAVSYCCSFSRNGGTGLRRESATRLSLRIVREKNAVIMGARPNARRAWKAATYKPRGR